MSRRLKYVAVASSLLACLLTPLTTLAHEEVTVGGYVFEIGWVKEPVVVGERNGLDLFITSAEASDEHDHAEEADEHDHAEEADEHDQPGGGVTSAEATLVFAVEYGPARQTYELRPVPGQPGRYTADILPTRPGQYTFHFSGTINGEAIELKFEPEAVEAGETLAFPEPLPSTAELTTQLAAAQAQAGTAQTVAIAGVVLGLIGTGLGVYGMLKK